MRLCGIEVDLRFPNLQGQLSPERSIQMGEKFGLEDTVQKRVRFL
jgi:hypothetical protein